jgi:hypothetical protein
MKEEEATPQQQLHRNPLLVKNKRPYARDGHSGIYFTHTKSNLPYMFVFGGDRHQMPFNDSFLLDLEGELMTN